VSAAIIEVGTFVDHDGSLGAGCRSRISATANLIPSAGLTQSWPNERICHTDWFEDPNLPGEMQVTITLKEVLCGTELNIVQEVVPDPIPPEMCYLGWQESLVLLAQLVEAEGG
jgi:hypothetical protein